MVPGFEEAVVYAVFVIGTALSLFAFFRGQRLRSGTNIKRSLRDDPAFAAMIDVSPAVGGETTVDAPSVKALLDLLAVLLENPIHRSMQGPWAKLGLNAGQIVLQRIDENELHFTAENLAIRVVRIRAETIDTRIRVRWMMEVPGAKTLITVGQIWALALAFPAAILGPYLVAKYLLSSAYSGQSLQVLQVFQVVWEPYLFLFLASQRMNTASRYLETLIAQAAYELRTGRRTLDK